MKETVFIQKNCVLPRKNFFSGQYKKFFVKKKTVFFQQALKYILHLGFENSLSRVNQEPSWIFEKFCYFTLGQDSSQDFFFFSEKHKNFFQRFYFVDTFGSENRLRLLQFLQLIFVRNTYKQTSTDLCRCICYINLFCTFLFLQIRDFK